jgi:hypothetical protein
MQQHNTLWQLSLVFTLNHWLQLVTQYMLLIITCLSDNVQGLVLENPRKMLVVQQGSFTCPNGCCSVRCYRTHLALNFMEMKSVVDDFIGRTVTDLSVWKFIDSCCPVVKNHCVDLFSVLSSCRQSPWLFFISDVCLTTSEHVTCTCFTAAKHYHSELIVMNFCTPK